MAWLILASESAKIVNPANVKTGFTVREIKRLIGVCSFELIFLADGRRMIASQHVDGEALNEFATALYHEGRNTARAIHGDVVVGTRSEIPKEETWLSTEKGCESRSRFSRAS